MYPDGSLYEGDFKDGQQDGNGRMIHTNKDIYEGKWKSGMAEGKGVITLFDGQKYTGKWKNDLKEGKGVENWPDGSVYEGQYHQGNFPLIVKDWFLYREIPWKRNLDSS